ncbi:MAG: Rid family detoxifying hydrolase [Erysipelotrichaceae bacterium]|nr:Rid family detoxifying hydrolase [Erysipelotrichaceae bacterium]
MNKTEIRTDNAPSPAGPYSQGIVAGDYIFVAGQRPVDPKTGYIPEDIQGQTRQVIKNIESILAEHGATLADVVRSGAYLSDLANFSAMNEVYSEMFPKPYPARTCIGTSLRGILVEINVIAYKPQNR